MARSQKFRLTPAFTSDIRATSWLSVLDGKHPTVLGNGIDAGVKPTEDVLFHRFKYCFPWWSHV